MDKAVDAADFRSRIGRDVLTVAVFKADWCPDCRFLDLFMADIEEAYRDRIAFLEIDRDDMHDVFIELDIYGIPSFVAFRKGREIVRFVSKLRKSRPEIERFLDRAIQVDAALGAPSGMERPPGVSD
jgi:thioredoxin-like negative regulator of GroEL